MSLSIYIIYMERGRENRTESAEVNWDMYAQLILDKGRKISQWGKNIFSTNLAGITRHLYAKKDEFRVLPHTIYQN